MHLLIALLLCCIPVVACAQSGALKPIELVDNYSKEHPRLLFNSSFKKELQERARKQPSIWAAMEAASKRLLSYVPNDKDVRHGAKYYRADWMLAASMAYFINGKKEYRDQCIKWMKAHCVVDIWGTGWGENVDIPANWYLYYISLSYDILYDDISEADRKIIVKGLSDHAKAIYDVWKKKTTKIRYDQNHTYVPIISLATAALVLMEEEPQAVEWLAYSHAMMKKCRQVLSDDGYYYEGTAYWEYAFHWHVRYADLISRATGEAAHDLPMFKKNYLFPIHLSLPGAPYRWDMGDSGWGKGRRTSKARFGRQSMLYRMADLHNNAEAQGVSNYLRDQGGDFDDPGMYLYWYNPNIKSTPISKFSKHHHFEDYGVITWRSSWGKDASVYMFKAGPPNGYSSFDKMKTLTEWYPNSGHVHPDIGMFWMYAHGEYLATDTGYTQRKRTRDHNTILVDGEGMGEDYNYWIYSGFPDRNIPYEKWTKVKLNKVHLEDAYGYAMADFSSAYEEHLGKLQIHRHCIMTKEALIIFDDLKGEKEHSFTSLVHADYEFKQIGTGIMKASVGDAHLINYTLNPDSCTLKNEAAIVFGGKKPNKGADEQRGFQLTQKSIKPTKHQQFINVLIPTKKDQADPQSVKLIELSKKYLRIQVNFDSKNSRTYSIDLSWKKGKKGPVTW